MKQLIATFLLCLCCAAMAGAQGLQIAAGYQYQRSHTLGDQSLNFNGGLAEVSYGLPRHFVAVGAFTGTDSSRSSAVIIGADLMTYMLGLRFQVPLNKKVKEAGRVSPFAEYLAGGARGTNGAFPQGGVLVSNANSFAFSAGGGLDIARTHHVTVRVIQADYLFTQLPNLIGTHQNNFTIGGGFVFRLR